MEGAHFFSLVNTFYYYEYLLLIITNYILDISSFDTTTDKLRNKLSIFEFLNQSKVIASYKLYYYYYL